jgi:UDP-N-acetylmuramyl tripeptide synthase
VGGLVADGALVCGTRAASRRLLALDEVPITLGGAARYNVTNALCAAAAASALGLPDDAIARGLRDFRSDPRANPGRLNEFRLGGARAIVDFAHNPHGLSALLDLAQRLPRERLLVLLGQAGDRDDAAIVELARVTAAARPDRVVVKRMNAHLRGRGEGEVAGLIDGALRAHGLAAAAIEHAPSELAGARRALEWARAGDLLLLLSHAEREAVLELLGALADSGWAPGRPLPV